MVDAALDRQSESVRANGFDVRAVGWAITYDTCADIVSIAFGGAPRMTQAGLRELTEQWTKLEQAQQGESSIRKAFSPASAPLAPRSAMALKALVQRMIALSPHRYSPDVLRRRSISSLVQTCIGCALGILLGEPTLSEPSFGAGAFILLGAGLWSLLGAVRLWRTYRIAKVVAPSTVRTI